MSIIARTVLRIEICDDFVVPDLFYAVEGFSSKESHTVESADVHGDHQSENTGEPFTTDSSAFLGQRKFSEIVIETYMAAKSNSGKSSLFEDSEDVKTSETPRQKTSSDTSQQRDSQVKIKSTSSIGTVPRATTPEGASSATKLREDDRQPSTKEHTISGALKNPLHKSHSIEYSGSDSPRTLKVSPRNNATAASCVTQPINLDIEEAKSRGSKGPSPIPDTVTFFSGNPSVETTEGVIHLYKENELVSQVDEGVRRGELVCMLRVPTTLTSLDIIQFIQPVARWIEHVKIIRDATPNYYMVLLKFDSQQHADAFFRDYNGQNFNSIERTQCHLVYVAKLETVKSSNGAGLPIPGMTELPVCPVCLERMDESVDGILTILCNHSFHTSCLSHWEDTSCPVCRYTQTPESVADNKCFECSAEESLWICLICGYVGCGRYVEGHAFNHYQTTNHTFSMQLGSNRVWDYAGDNYVHRLVQNKSDGKMVEVGEEGLNCEGEEKLDSITLEYTYLLNTQLESQRHYFEDKLSLMEAEALKQLGDSEEEMRKAKDRCLHLEGNLNSENSKRKLAEKKFETLSEKYRSVLSEFSEEQEMSKNLCENQTVLKTQISQLKQQMDKKDQELNDLREQLRDLMIYLDAQTQLSSTSGVTREEIEDSTVVVGASPNSQPKKPRKKGGRS